MSLTNPKDVVTEERLKDFYDSIYPYLGGMPEILANKFSRSDIYSTEEKMIGQWTDGKPLYQKIVTTGGSVPSGATLIFRQTMTGYDAILYTKSTDSAISIGVDTDYSTTEKIVGTWIDGSYIYKKTINCGALPNNTTKNVAHGISNLEILIKWELSSSKDSDNMYWPSPYTSSSNINTQLQFDLSLTNIMLITHENWSGTNAYITLYYTKTS